MGGWQVEGGIPAEVKKCVMVAAPHTSNFDFGITRAVFYMLDIKVRYLAKKELMTFPLGGFFKATGAISVERDKKSNLVDHMVDILNRSEEMVILVAPEGTRKLSEKWKTGFYYAALKAEVPIILAFLDYKRKVGGIGHMFYPTGDLISDMQQIKDFYRNIIPRHPENFSLEII